MADDPVAGLADQADCCVCFPRVFFFLCEHITLVFLLVPTCEIPLWLIVEPKGATNEHYNKLLDNNKASWFMVLA